MKGRAVLLILSFLLAACDEGSKLNPNTKTIDPVQGWRLSAAGWDLRIYEFDSQTDPNIRCLMVAGEAKGGLQCWRKE